MSCMSENNAVSDITTTLSQIESHLSRLQPYRAHLLRRNQLQIDQILDLPIVDMAVQGMALVDPLSEAGAAFGFGLSRLHAVSLYLSEPLLPTPHFEQVVREANLAACVALAFFRVGFDRLEQVVSRNRCRRCRSGDWCNGGRNSGKGVRQVINPPH